MEFQFIIQEDKQQLKKEKKGGKIIRSFNFSGKSILKASLFFFLFYSFAAVYLHIERKNQHKNKIQ
jgi:hypothetical protein